VTGQDVDRVYGIRDGGWTAEWRGGPENNSDQRRGQRTGGPALSNVSKFEIIHGIIHGCSVYMLRRPK
jgi:hypothetical protein